MYHYILLFINKVLYYIRIPFLHIENPFCDFVIVIVWLGIKPYPTASPDPSERRGGAPSSLPEKGGECLPKPLRKEGSASSQVFCRKLSDKEPCPYPSCAHRHSPPFGGVGGGCRAGGGFCISLCKTDSYKGICGTCYSSTPKNDCFLNKVAYLCKQKRKAPPDLPERGGDKFASILQKIIWEKSQKSLSSYVRIGTPPPSGRLGGASPPLRMERGVNSEISPKMFRS